MSKTEKSLNEFCISDEHFEDIFGEVDCLLVSVVDRPFSEVQEKEMFFITILGFDCDVFTLYSSNSLALNFLSFS